MPSYKILTGDCRDWLPKLGPVPFVFADPPFNIGENYDIYSDNISADAYRSFTYEWMELAWYGCSGVMVVHGPDALAELYLEVARALDMTRIAWINWHYRFGQCRRTTWVDARTHALIYAHRSHTWNPDAVCVPSDRAAVYSDPRIHDTPRGGERLPGTVWGVPSDGAYWGRVTGNSRERRSKHENQLPELYLKRLILAYTNESDWCLDPFGGSGTTATVACSLNRNAVTIELSPDYCDSIEDRIKKGMVR